MYSKLLYLRGLLSLRANLVAKVKLTRELTPRPKFPWAVGIPSHPVENQRCNLVSTGRSGKSQGRAGRSRERRGIPPRGSEVWISRPGNRYQNPGQSFLLCSPNGPAEKPGQSFLADFPSGEKSGIRRGSSATKRALKHSLYFIQVIIQFTCWFFFRLFPCLAWCDI
jgi:hypothetical protein